MCENATISSNIFFSGAFVNNIASNPCDLKVQVFFLTNFSGLGGTIGATGPQ